MSAPYPVRPEPVRPRGTAPLQEAVKALLPLACAGFLAACSGAPPVVPLASADPSDAAARVPPASYRPVVVPYASQRPVEPKPWIEQNQAITPEVKP